MMPLGPQLMRVFHVTPHEFGLLVSAYTFGAAASGFLAAFHVDRFDRKTALLGIYAGFAVTTLLCALAPGFWTLLAARAAAGIFGGVAGRRGLCDRRRSHSRAAPRHGDGRDLVGFLAVGHRRRADRAVPRQSLRLARTVRIAHGRERPALDRGWRLLPETGPASARPPREFDTSQLRAVFANRNHLNAFALTATLMFAGFSVIPFISPYMVANVGLAETDLPYLYFAGGLATLFTSRWIGRLSDRHGKKRMFRVVATISDRAAAHHDQSAARAGAGRDRRERHLHGVRVGPIRAGDGAGDGQRRAAPARQLSRLQQFDPATVRGPGGILGGPDHGPRAGRADHVLLGGRVSSPSRATLACIWLSGRVRPAEPPP